MFKLSILNIQILKECLNKINIINSNKNILSWSWTRTPKFKYKIKNRKILNNSIPLTYIKFNRLWKIEVFYLLIKIIINS
jgi:hypothetical protein